MRIVILSAGTGSFHCGSCMRDNALAVALQKMGHDAMLLPMYLPMTLDEPSATENAPLFYGGVNVYLQQKSGLFRKTPQWVDRVLDSPALLKAAGARAGMTKPTDLGELTLSTLLGEEGKQAKELDRLVGWLNAELKADVVVLSNALFMGLARKIRSQTGAAVVCTLQGEDAFIDSLGQPFAGQSWDAMADRSQDVDAFLGVSNYYSNLMQQRARLPAERVFTVYNGIRLDGYEQEARVPEIPTIGYLARMCYTKGLHTLIDAFIELKRRNRVPNARLRVAGSMTAADESFVAEQRSKLAKAGVVGDVEFSPNVDRSDKVEFLRSLSLLSVPAVYGESFGLYLLEAWGVGVPVVQPNHAAFPELIRATGGGILFDPESPSSYVDTLEEALLAPERLRAMGRTAREFVFERFSVEAMATESLKVFEFALARRQEQNALRV